MDDMHCSSRYGRGFDPPGSSVTAQETACIVRCLRMNLDWDIGGKDTVMPLLHPQTEDRESLYFPTTLSNVSESF